MDGTTQPAAAPRARRISSRSMLAYGFGAVAYGVKDAGFQTFLLLFYNQVIGLPAVQVGAAIMAHAIAVLRVLEKEGGDRKSVV